MGRYNCSIPECGFSTGSSLGMKSHARKHRNTYKRFQGKPDDYEEVREFFRENPGLMRRSGERRRQPPGEDESQLSLDEFSD